MDVILQKISEILSTFRWFLKQGTKFLNDLLKWHWTKTWWQITLTTFSGYTYFYANDNHNYYPPNLATQESENMSYLVHLVTHQDLNKIPRQLFLFPLTCSFFYLYLTCPLGCSGWKVMLLHQWGTLIFLLSALWGLSSSCFSV